MRSPPSLSMLAVAGQGGLGFLVELREWAADTTGTGELTAGAPSGAEHQRISDGAKFAQSIDVFGDQVHVGVAPDLADRGSAVRFAMKKRVPGATTGEGLARAQV